MDPICGCPECGRSLATQLRWALLLAPHALPREVVCGEIDLKSDEQRPCAWVVVRCRRCGTDTRVHREYPLAST